MPGTDMDGDPAHVVAHYLAFSGVKAGADLEFPATASPVTPRMRSEQPERDRQKRRRIRPRLFLISRPLNRASSRRTTRLWPSRRSCQRRSPSSAAFSVAPTMSVKSTVAKHGQAVSMTDARQEFLDFAKYDISIAQPREMIRPRQFDEARSRNTFRHIAAGSEFDRQITRAMQKQSWDADRRKNVPNVDFSIHCCERRDFQPDSRSFSASGPTIVRNPHPQPCWERVRRVRPDLPIPVAYGRSTTAFVHLLARKGSPPSGSSLESCRA